MKLLALTFTCLAFVACDKSSTTGPDSPIAPSGGSAAAAEPGDPNHFAPDPFMGFDGEKWHDLNYKEPKYLFGRALVGLEPNDDNLERVAIAQGLEYLGKDLIAFPDGQVVDCIYDFNGPDARWHWQLSH